MNSVSSSNNSLINMISSSENDQVSHNAMVKQINHVFNQCIAAELAFAQDLEYLYDRTTMDYQFSTIMDRQLSRKLMERICQYYTDIRPTSSVIDASVDLCVGKRHEYFKVRNENLARITSICGLPQPPK